ncbi:MAG: biosynthetic peptidoglycan transglycosylase [Bacteroidales bacterium]
MQHKIAEVQDTYALKIAYTSFKVKGLNTLEIKGLKVNDSLFTLDEAHIQFSFFKMLFGKLSLRSIDSKNLFVSLVKTDSSSNFEHIYKGAKEAENYIDHLVHKKVNYKREISKLSNLIFNLLPSDAHFVNTSISYTNPTYSIKINCAQWVLANQNYTAEIRYIENNAQVQNAQTWRIKGLLNHKTEKISCICYAKDTQNMQIPFIRYKWNADVQSDTLFFTWENKNEQEGKLILEGQARIRGLHIYHPKIDQEPLLLEQPSANFTLRIGENSIELDSASVLSCNGFSFNPYIRAEKKAQWHLVTRINKANFEAQQFFSALPPTLFTSLYGIETKGTLSYHFLLDIDFSHLDTLKLESHLSSKNFNISKYGNANLAKMSQAFLYTAYEHGVPVKTFEVSPAYPAFTPLAEVSPVLQMAILQSEDGGFFYHQGFLSGAFQKALITNIKRGKFAKGGSTISMQLVKNVFLSRNKTIARKMEEMLLVWLIETQRLTSKDRMFEVYLNIIEWGPGIYGVGEATQYYFGKTPAQVNTQEAIFLASIIPSPKRALQMFDAQVKLRPYIAGHYRLVTERLKIKGVISPEEALEVKPEVTLRLELQHKVEQMYQSQEEALQDEKEF